MLFPSSSKFYLGLFLKRSTSLVLSKPVFTKHSILYFALFTKSKTIGFSKTQTQKTQIENPLGVSKTQTQNLKPSGCLENPAPKSKTIFHSEFIADYFKMTCLHIYMRLDTLFLLFDVRENMRWG